MNRDYRFRARDRWMDLYNTLGIDLLFISNEVNRNNGLLINDLIDDGLDFIAPMGAAIYSVEGPNEYDGVGLKYSVADWPSRLTSYQRDLYNQLKAHPALSRAKRVGPSLINRNMSKAENMSAICDYGNMHLYVDHPGGDAGGSVFMTWAQMMTQYDRVYGANKAGMITETGAHNAILPNGFRHNSYRIGAKMAPRQFTEYFRDNRDWTTVAHYELVDERVGTNYQENDAEDNWGLLYRDMTPKPAFTSLKNLITLLNDTDGTFTPASLNYTITGSDMSDVRHLLLQKGNGKFYLCTWLELPKNKSYNSSTGQEFDPTRSLTLNFGSSIASLKRYEPCHPDSLDSGTTAKQTCTNPAAFGITVHDWITVYEVELAGSAPPDLVVTSVGWTPANPTVGTGVTFRATVRNQGTIATPAGTILGVSFKVDGKQVSWSDTHTSSLAASDSVTLTANSGPSGSLTWTATEGAHTVEAHVDDINRIAERDDTNNKLTASLPVETASISSFTLINADTDQPIVGFDPIANGAVIDYTQLGTTHLSIRANTSPARVGSVKFGYDSQANYRTENQAPYAIAGDENQGGDYFAWTPSLGSHTLTATPYVGGNATGTAGRAESLCFTVTNQGTNLALFKAVTFTSQQAGNGASQAVDNDETTRWSASNYPQTLRVDLGKVYRLNRTELAPYGNRAYRYKVEVSTDGTTYTQVVNKTGNTTGGSVLVDSFGAVSARYVRLTVTGAYNYTGGWVSVNEFKVFGKELLTVNAGLAYEPQGGEREESEAVLYPNPASQAVRVEYTASQAGQVQLRLLDKRGRPCLTTIYQAVKGSNTFRVDVGALPGGFYAVQLQGPGLPVVKKLVIAR